jgi:tyrosinase
MNGEHPPYLRRDVWTLPPEDPIMTAYAGAVKTMKEREQEDPTSWAYQAAIHGTYATPNKQLWNECQHGTWFFLPWHRMFLWYFERIVRAAVIANGGPADWALPYWNYGNGDEHAELPLAFRDERLANGEQNPLYVQEREPGMNSGTGSIPEEFGSPSDALARDGFIGKTGFGGDRTAPNHRSKGGQGELEETPHNVVHGLVGGLMSDPQTAANDPIFWLHHANIDRIWSLWIGMPGANHQDPPEAAWLGHSFSFFDANPKTAALRCDQVLATIPDLDYTYDTEPSPAPPPAPAPAPGARIAAAVRPPQREMIGATDQESVLTGTQLTVSIPIDARAAQPIAPDVHVYLNVEEIEGDRNPGTAYLVYADPEDGRPLAEQSERRVGNLAFFGIERAREPAGDHAPHALESSYEITPIARELEARGAWAGDELRVTFEPLSLVAAEGAPDAAAVTSVAHEEHPVRLGRLSVFYDA